MTKINFLVFFYLLFCKTMLRYNRKQSRGNKYGIHGRII